MISQMKSASGEAHINGAGDSLESRALVRLESRP